MYVVILTAAAICLGQTPYESAKAESLRTHKPLVVGAGCAPPSGDWVTAIVGRLEGVQGPCVVVARGWWTPGDESSKHLRPVATLPAGATADDVRRVLGVPTERPRPPLRRRWDPYNQPNYQGRMNR